jgi:hypothetical protein
MRAFTAISHRCVGNERFSFNEAWATHSDGSDG